MRTIRFADNWRPDERTLIHSGDYRVPSDLSEELAQRAVEDGVAEVVKVAKPAAEPAQAAEPAAPAEKPAAKRSKG
jgi:hypothetical protein